MSKLGGELAPSLALHLAASSEWSRPRASQEVMKEVASGRWVGLAYSQGLALGAQHNPQVEVGLAEKKGELRT